jgi:SAM-dependent methyltransferase
MTASEPRWAGEDAVRLPFDQYQRYSGAARLVDRLVGGADYSMLEVGGAPGFPEIFFAASRLAVVDRFGKHEGNFVVVDGARLPFDDESFDVVVTLDTLEHIVPQDRPAFLAECRRVSRDLVVLSAPHATAHVVEAELALQSFVTARFGEVFETLQEHADRGPAGRGGDRGRAGCRRLGVREHAQRLPAALADGHGGPPRAAGGRGPGAAGPARLLQPAHGAVRQPGARLPAPGRRLARPVAGRARRGRRRAGHACAGGPRRRGDVRRGRAAC